jgi:pimeloyl-ACP methyl ester carboxylesterase
MLSEAGQHLVPDTMTHIPLSDWQSGGHLFDYRGHRIFYRVDGAADAPALLLIHGFPTASWDWEAMWTELVASYRVYTLDMIGFGLSDKPADYRYTIADQANLFEAFLRRESVQRYHALAHDYGDTVAQELLARQGEPGERPQMLSLALLNGGLFPETHRALLTQKLLLSPLGPLLARLTNRKALSRSFKRIFGAGTPPDEVLLDGCWKLMQHQNGRRVLPRLIRYIIERREQRARWVGALQMSAVPIKLIVGAVDPISGAHMAERFRKLIPRPDISLLEDIGHYPQCEAPHTVLREYLRFRDERCLPGGSACLY